uniref:Uncharacterized protein n=1 Tax=Cannabis sativa TaxID=3483 RepID=A0A803PQ08_CANSA
MHGSRSGLALDEPSSSYIDNDTASLCVQPANLAFDLCGVELKETNATTKGRGKGVIEGVPRRWGSSDGGKEGGGGWQEAMGAVAGLGSEVEDDMDVSQRLLIPCKAKESRA